MCNLGFLYLLFQKKRDAIIKAIAECERQSDRFLLCMRRKIPSEVSFRVDRMKWQNGEWVMKRIGIYHFQYKVGGCKICYQHYINGMLRDFEQCHTVAQRIYGKDIEFFHFTDFGNYDDKNLDRPSFIRMLEAIDHDELDVIMCCRLNGITTNEDLLIEFYKNVRAKGLDFITMEHGLDAMKYIDAYIEKKNAQ